MEKKKEISIAMKEGARAFAEKVKELGIVDEVIAQAEDSKEFYEIFDGLIALEILKLYDDEEMSTVADCFDRIVEIGIKKL